MPTAVILLNVEGQQTGRIAQAIASLEGVSEVYSVAGHYDLVAVVRVAANEDLADLVTDKIRSIPGILGSQTLIAFRAYSAAEITGMFNLD